MNLITLGLSRGCTCQLIGNVPYCQCPALNTGARCEPYIGSITATTTAMSGTPCAPNPCMNGGMCTIVNNSHYCQCTSAYTGANCEAVILSSK